MVWQTSLSADCAEVASGKLSPGSNIRPDAFLRLQGVQVKEYVLPPQQPPDGIRRVDVKCLELPQMQKPEHLIEIATVCADWSSAFPHASPCSSGRHNSTVEMHRRRRNQES
jgi:hypothetical protein